jgi:hypothetical protein
MRLVYLIAKIINALPQLSNNNDVCVLKSKKVTYAYFASSNLAAYVIYRYKKKTTLEN